MRNYIVWVHGIGEQEPGAYRAFEAAVRQAYARRAARGGQTVTEDAINWADAFWAPVTQGDQNELRRILGIKGALRKFMIGSLGDAVAYSRVAESGGKYDHIQEIFAKAVEGLSQKASQLEGPGVKAPLTVVAHSLGTVIATGSLDSMRRAGRFPANLELKNLFTMGSPIAVYGLRYGLANFSRPTQAGQWTNYYYPHDMIGYPLQPLGGPWQTAVRDVALSHSGGVPLLKGLRRALASRMYFYRNAASHSWYFADRRVADGIASALAV
jgi:hypothetical protein